MALEWPDFTQATITDAETFDALKRAYAERCAAASAGAGHAVPDDAEYWGADVTPDLDRLVSLRNAIRSLAPKFVRLEDERYRWKSWVNFPIAYTGADLMKGEHSLAILPAPGTPEGDPARLADYRRFLANCAWWLRQFRYVDVTGQSFYTRESSASGSRSVSDSENWGHQESGEPMESYLAAATHTDLPSRSVVTPRWPMAVFTHKAQWAAEDVYFHDEGWQYDYWVYEWESISAEFRSGLVVRNHSGLDGRLMLVAGYYPFSSYWLLPTRHYETEVLETLIPDATSGKIYGYYAGKVRFGESWLQLRDSRWLPNSETVFDGEQYWEDDRIARSGLAIYVNTKWSDDGLRSFPTETEDEWDSWYDYTTMETYNVYRTEFDGFGNWELGTPVDKGIVPAHGRIEAVPKSDEIPKPADWDLKPWDRAAARKHPRDQWRTVENRSVIRLIPILDFNSSYLYQDT